MLRLALTPPGGRRTKPRPWFRSAVYGQEAQPVPGADERLQHPQVRVELGADGRRVRLDFDLAEHGVERGPPDRPRAPWVGWTAGLTRT
jgi:hypothetical protein